MATEGISSLINNAESTGRPFFSVELLPGTTSTLQQYLRESLNCLPANPPLFASITWHNVHTVHDSGELCHPSLPLVDLVQNQFNINTCLHLAAGALNRDQIQEILCRSLSMGVRNVLALRGDPKPKLGSDFQHAVDLVRFIREKFETKFTIGVAGYPTGHTESSYDDGLIHLKEKVDAGADFIISQLVFRAEDFTNFVDDCRARGIKVPIIPGLLITEMLPDATSLERIATLTNVSIPPEIRENLERMKNDAALQTDYVQNLSVNIGRELMASRKSPGIHFFSMNRCSQVIHVWKQICKKTVDAFSFAQEFDANTEVQRR